VPDEQERHPVGSHTLGPHVVGQRIVVRRILRGQTGPSGGPAMTDLLGVCTTWGDGVCIVQPESGAPVRIALADVVSGKPVPPRPSIRHRVSPAAAQVRGFALFPDLETRPVGDWVLRRSATASARRANSVLAFGPSGVDGDVEEVLAFYSRPIAAVLPDSREDELFRDLGWGVESHDADTVFQLAGVSQVRRALRGLPPPVLETPAMVETHGPHSVTARIGTLASGFAAYADDWVGFRGIEVASEHRRRGLGLAVMAELLDWGAQRGATTAYLQVLGDNEPALALYDKLGFTPHHSYRYLAPPALADG